ncbi:ribosomal RNA-processing protein 7 homolog A-like [Haliotis cracherodii]|uniref:ribosomal RNA-processing protein 7 homolog A-like n=1 Tax=Haliotis cracherodii TaxID=6455 RepID=UPI0039EA1408
MAASDQEHVPVTVQGFTVVPLKFSEDKTAHCLYLKEHSVRENDSSHPRNRTLFVLNVPPYCNEDCVKQLFTPCGKIVQVYLHDKPTSAAPPSGGSRYFPVGLTTPGFKVAYIVFKNALAVKHACKLSYETPLVLNTPEKTVSSTGLHKWCRQYAARRVDVKELQAEIEDYMAKFDTKQEEETQRLKDQEGVADEEGWVTVTRVGKNKGTPRTEARKKHLTKRETKRRKEKELLNFYAFQFKETKKDQIATLRKKFEEDKQKISVMKAARKFKPY